MKKSNLFYSNVSVLVFFYVIFVSGLYMEWALLEHFVVPADYEVLVETKIRYGVPEDTPLTDKQVTELLSQKVTKQRNLAVFAILVGSVFSIVCISGIAIFVSKY